MPDDKSAPWCNAHCASAAEALKPFAGDYAALVFALGIIGTGLLAVPVLAGSAAYAIGEAGPMFARLLREASVDVDDCGTLDAAVKSAAAEARAGDTVLLSPACASFDQFRDFEARGDAFRAAVEAL